MEKRRGEFSPDLLARKGVVNEEVLETRKSKSDEEGRAKDQREACTQKRQERTVHSFLTKVEGNRNWEMGVKCKSTDVNKRGRRFTFWGQGKGVQSLN